MVRKTDFDETVPLPPGLTVTAGAAGGGRTHTFGLKNPATRLKGRTVYRRKDVAVTGNKAVPINGD